MVVFSVTGPIRTIRQGLKEEKRNTNLKLKSGKISYREISSRPEPILDQKRLILSERFSEGAPMQNGWLGAAGMSGFILFIGCKDYSMPFGIDKMQMTGKSLLWGLKSYVFQEDS